jgi:hypothetical protein
VLCMFLHKLIFLSIYLLLELGNLMCDSFVTVSVLVLLFLHLSQFLGD